MSDRVILMRSGRIVQAGPPRELFDRPASRFVADFMGVENILEGTLAALDGERATVGVGGQQVAGIWCGQTAAAPETAVFVGVRAERIRLGGPLGDGAPDRRVNQMACAPGITIYKGKYLDQSLATEIGTIKARIWDSSIDLSRIGSLSWPTGDCMVMPA